MWGFLNFPKPIIFEWEWKVVRMQKLFFALLLLASFASGCCSPCPNPPHETASQPKFVVDNFVHHVKNECWDQTYDLLSPKTRESNSYIKWRVGVPNLTFPETEIKVRDIISKGDTLGITPYDDDENPQEYLWILEDKIPGGPPRVRLFNILLVKEASNKNLWRIGLQEHIDRNFSISAE